MTTPDVEPAAAAIVGALAARGLTLGTAESLTGGMVCAALTAVPGASAVVRGGVAAYATDLKTALLGVDAGLLAREGAVHPEVARAMALGALAALDVDVAVACTGVAGPDPQDGHRPGEVHLAVAVRSSDGGPADRVAPAATTTRVLSLDLPGDRTAVRAATVGAALALLAETAAGLPTS